MFTMQRHKHSSLLPLHSKHSGLLQSILSTYKYIVCINFSNNQKLP